MRKITPFLFVNAKILQSESHHLIANTMQIVDSKEFLRSKYSTASATRI